MKLSKLTESCRRVAMAPIHLVASCKFWWRHGPISKEAAERIDRIRNPQTYLIEVNARKKP